MNQVSEKSDLLSVAETNAPLRFAVDASQLAGDTDGLSRYLTELLVRLVAATADTVHWTLFTRQPLDRWEKFPNVDVIADRLPKHLGRITWQLLLASRKLKGHHFDLLWAPTQRIPRGIPDSLPIVVTVHDLAWIKAPKTMRITSRVMDRLLMPASNRKNVSAIAVSQSTATDLSELLDVSREQITVVHNGAAKLAQPNLTASTDKPPLSGRQYFLFVGTIEPRKNTERLLLAYHKARQARPRFPALVIVGEKGWGQKPLSRYINELELNDDVFVAGKVTNESLHVHYQNALAVVLPSLYEGFGLPLAEGMQYGLPLLTSNRSCLPEVAGDAGLLVDPISIQDIATGMTRLATEPELTEGLRQKSRSRGALFSWEKSAQETLNVLLGAARQR